MRLESLLGLSWDLPGDFLRLLDRNFTKLSRETAPYQVAADYRMRVDDTVDSVQVDATAGAVTVYLPDQPVGNRRRRVIKTDASANAVTINGNGSLINGAATVALAAQYNSRTVEPTETGWLVVAST